MITSETTKLYPSSKILVTDHVASRILEKDASLYDFSEEAKDSAEHYMGWADLATDPCCDLDEIMAFANEVYASGMKTVVLLGQGGSTQAPMTITKYNKGKNRMKFIVLDSDSPVRFRELRAQADPATTLFIVASKSGGTIEPRMMLKAVTETYGRELGNNFPKHLVAITDPGSNLEKTAHEQGWLKVFLGVPEVGGRFSALSVFGLVPAALVGIDLHTFVAHAKAAQDLCSADQEDNPAIDLAAFLFDNYTEGKDKFSFFSPKRGLVFGLWIEQLIAESLGKDGQGILPSIEMDPLLLTEKKNDRCVITYETQSDVWDEMQDFELGISVINADIPRMAYQLNKVEEVAEHFILWEYATAMCGYLMKIAPFNQPDVQSTKTAVLGILADGIPEPDYTETFVPELTLGKVEVRQSQQFAACKKLEDTLSELLSSIGDNDYFAVNAFLPFTERGRKCALESIRHTVASEFGVVASLEIGPRYLHSTGQLQKGGKNNGVFLTLSTNELKDIGLPAGSEAPSLGSLAKAQAIGDMETLAERGRRAVSLHLPDSSPTTLRTLANLIAKIARDVKQTR